VVTFRKAKELLSVKKNEVLNLGNGPLDGTEHVSESSQYVSELDVSKTTRDRHS